MFQSDLLKNKTILITGGGTGLGKLMATRFGELGANLIITSRRQNVLDDAAEELRKTGADVLLHSCDVRDPLAVTELLEKVKSKFKSMPFFAKANSGHIGLQHHGEEVWYRNIRIRKL